MKFEKCGKTVEVLCHVGKVFEQNLQKIYELDGDPSETIRVEPQFEVTFIEKLCLFYESNFTYFLSCHKDLSDFSTENLPISHPCPAQSL